MGSRTRGALVSNSSSRTGCAVCNRGVDPLEQALNNLTDDRHFETLSRRVLAAEGYKIDPRGGSADSGRDSIEGGTSAKPKAVFQFSLRRDSGTKLGEELARYGDGGHIPPEEYVYVTNRRVSAETKDSYSERFAKIGIRLRVLDLDWFSTVLTLPIHALARHEILAPYVVQMPDIVRFALQGSMRNAALQMLQEAGRVSVVDERLRAIRVLLAGGRYAKARSELEEVLAIAGTHEGAAIRSAHTPGQCFNAAG